MRKAFLSVTDTSTGIERKFPSWMGMASYVISHSVESNDYTRYLPACNNWNLDYPERGESVEDYRARMIDMAIGLQLIG